jgi:hypothetical protein
MVPNECLAAGGERLRARIGYTARMLRSVSLVRTLCWSAVAAVLVCASSSLGAEPSAAGPATIEVTARLVGIPGKYPADDLYDYAYVMQYQVEGGALDQQKIFVAHYKPRRARAEIDDAMKKYVGGTLKRFEVGARHRLVLTGDMRKVWKGAVVDEFFDSDRKSKRYFCLKADPASGS